MRKYLLPIVYILSFFVFPTIIFAEKIYPIVLSNNFEGGIIEANNEILQSETFSITKESGKWFIAANIRPKDSKNTKIYILPHKKYIEFDENKSCYEEFSLYILPQSKLIVVERQIINHTNQSHSYISYGGSLITYKLK